MAKYNGDDLCSKGIGPIVLNHGVNDSSDMLEYIEWVRGRLIGAHADPIPACAERIDDDDKKRARESLLAALIADE